jgi:hypothetical protein
MVHTVPPTPKGWRPLLYFHAEEGQAPRNGTGIADWGLRIAS